MGANQSRGTQSIKAKINHPKFRNAIIQVQKNNPKISTTLTVDKTVYSQWKLKLQQFFKLKPSTQYLFLPMGSLFKNKGMCTSSGSAQLVFQNYPHLLRQEIYERHGKKSRFSQPQLWYLLYSLVNAKIQFLDHQINNANLGDIRPDNIFLSQKGQIKVSSVLSFPGQQSNYKKSLVNNSSQNQIYFLSPQEIFQLQLGSMSNDANSSSQQFSIGLTVLSAGITDPLSDLYDMNQKKFKFFELNKKIVLWKQSQYSQILIATVLGLCEVQPTHRLTCKQLYDMLSDNQSFIKQRKPFVISMAPYKIDSIIKKIRTQKKTINTQTLIPNNLQSDIRTILSNDKSNSQNSKKKNQRLSLTSGNIGSSIRLTQAILEPPSPFTPGKEEAPSLFSSTDIVLLRKVQSTNLPSQPLKRYQQINANQIIRKSNQSQSHSQFNQALQTSNSYIVQQPVVFDKNRPSDDIQEQITPTSTPLQQTLQNQKQPFLNDVIFQNALGLSDSSNIGNIVKTKNVATLEAIVSSPRKIRQSQSLDPQKEQSKPTVMLHSHRVNQSKNNQSNDSHKQSESQQFLSLQKQSKGDERVFSELKGIKITQQTDVYLEESIPLKQIEMQKKSSKKKVHFHYQEGNSEFLQIENIDLEHIKGQQNGDQSIDNILIHYKERNNDQQVIQKVILPKNKDQIIY